MTLNFERNSNVKERGWGKGLAKKKSKCQECQHEGPPQAQVICAGGKSVILLNFIFCFGYVMTDDFEL